MQVLLAGLKLARAEYACLTGLPTSEEAYLPVLAYLGSEPATAVISPGVSAGDSAEELAEVLRLYITARMVDSPVDAARSYAALAQQLAAPECKRRLQRQLDQLASSHWQQERLLTVEQLRYKCYLSVTSIAAQNQQPPGGQLSELQAAAASAAQAMCQLEPANPFSHMRMADALLVKPTKQHMGQAAQCHMRIFELVQQQRSDVWTVYGAVHALMLSAFAPLEAGRNTLEAALAAFEQTAEESLRRCKRLLPEQWVQPLPAHVELVTPMLPQALSSCCCCSNRRASASALRPRQLCKPAAMHRRQHCSCEQSHLGAALSLGWSATAVGRKQWGCAAAAAASGRSTAGVCVCGCALHLQMLALLGWALPGLGAAVWGAC